MYPVPFEAKHLLQMEAQDRDEFATLFSANR